MIKKHVSSHIFLRDNCQCPTCFHPVAKSRLVDTIKAVDRNIQPKETKCDYSGNEIIVEWPDKHVSKFSGKWLRQRKFPENWKHVIPSTSYHLDQIPWGSADMKNALPLVNFVELMENENVLIRHLENLIIRGLSIITDAPTAEGVIDNLTERTSLGYKKITHYG